jgi:hypothetical protein
VVLLTEFEDLLDKAEALRDQVMDYMNENKISDPPFERMLKDMVEHLEELRPGE